MHSFLKKFATAQCECFGFCFGPTKWAKLLTLHLSRLQNIKGGHPGPVDPVHVRSCNACQPCVNHLPLRQPVTGFSAKIIVFCRPVCAGSVLCRGFKLFCFAFVQLLSQPEKKGSKRDSGLMDVGLCSQLNVTSSVQLPFHPLHSKPPTYHLPHPKKPAKTANCHRLFEAKANFD